MDSSYTIGASDLIVYVPTVEGNVVNDVTRLEEFNHVALDVSSLLVEISAPELHYKSNGCYSFTVLLGGDNKASGRFPVLLSFTPHKRHPVGQIRNGQKADHALEFLGCESLLLKGDYYYHPVVSDEVTDSVFLNLSLSNIRCILYPEVYNTMFNLILNVLSDNQYLVSEEDFHAMQNANRWLFYYKYFCDFREMKPNIVSESSHLHPSSRRSRRSLSPARPSRSPATSSSRCLSRSRRTACRRRTSIRAVASSSNWTRWRWISPQIRPCST